MHFLKEDLYVIHSLLQLKTAVIIQGNGTTCRLALAYEFGGDFDEILGNGCMNSEKFLVYIL